MIIATFLIRNILFDSRRIKIELILRASQTNKHLLSLQLFLTYSRTEKIYLVYPFPLYSGITLPLGYSIS